MDDYPVDSILVGAEEFVYTTHVTHQQLFYVHVDSRSKILDDIMNKLETRYTHLRHEEKPLLNKRLGSLCAAKFTDDGVWYRAKITGLLKNGQFEVQFVDYGNTDYVTEERIKAIDADLIKYPVQSYRCCLSDVSCPQGFWTPELIIQFEDRVIDRRCRATFVGENEDEEMYLLQMCDSEGNNINQLFGAVSPAGKKAVQNGVFPGSGFKEISFDLGAVFHAAIVYVNSPGLFWCQNMQFASDILILSEELSRLHMIQEMKPLQDVHRGVVCAAKFSQDEAWYRGIVHSVSGSKAKVYFVDYGNTEVVSLDVVCNLKPEMRTLPALGIKCRLSNMDSKGREWTQEVIEAFEELVVDKEFEVKVVGTEGDVYIVTLFDVVDNKDVGAQLQSVRHSVNLDSKHQDINCNKQMPAVAAPGIGPSFNVGSQADVYISWVESPGDFWVQQRSGEKLLEQLSQQLQDVYSHPQPSAQPTPGAFVVARFSQDQMWYRSVVLKVFEDEKVRVLFIDYGNSDVVAVSDLRQVTAAFGQVIPLASRCCLAGVNPPQKGDKSWPPEAKTFLEKISEYGCQCEILSETSSHKIVNLKVGGRDVAKDLLNTGVVCEATAESKSFPPLFLPELTVKRSETEQVIVTHIDSPKNFWCQVTTNIPLLRDLMKQLSQHYACGNNILLEKPIIGQACIVFSNKDKLWYRAKITNISSSTYGVHFLDFGTSDVVPKCNVFVPEPKFMDLTAQAFHCGISVSQDLSLITNAFKQAVCKKELCLQVLEVSGDRAVVELFDGNMKVSEMLNGSTNVSKDTEKEVDFVPAKEIPAGSTAKTFASFVVSPNKFFIHMTGVDEELEDLMDNIALVYNCEKAPPVVAHPHSGQPCVALYAEDGNWYRGRIVAVQGSACIVLFVDFGNEDTVNNENIRVLTPELAQVPVLSYKCSIHGVPDTEWSDDALQYFEALVMEKELTCTFVASSSVRVLVGGQDVASQLLKAGYGGGTPPGQGLLGRQGESGSGVSMGSKQSPSDRVTEISTGSDRGQPQDDGVWDSHESASAGHKHAGSHSFGKKEDSGTKSDRRLKYTDVRREESTLGDGRAGRESGGRNGRDARVEGDRRDWQSGDGRDSGGRRDWQSGDGRDSGGRRDWQSGDGRDSGGRRDWQSGDGRDSGGRRGRDSRFEGDRLDWQSGEGRDSRRGMASRFEGDRRDLQSNEGRDSRRGRDSRFENDRRDWQSGEGRDSGRRGDPHRRDVESGGSRDALGRQGRGSRFEGAPRNGEGRDSDSSSGGHSDRNSAGSYGRESRLGGGRGQGNIRFNGSRESTFSSGHNDRRMTTGQPSASMNTDFTYPETPCEAVSTILVHMDEDGTFYLQLPSMEKDILLVSTRVAGSYKGGSGPRLRETPVVGTVCCAKFADDGNMYRAKVEDVQGSRAVLRYVDYGNTGECSLSDLKFLFPDLLQYPVQAFPCQLRGYQWSLDEAEQFAKATLDKDLKVTFISSTCPFQVDIMTPEGDLLKVLTGESAPPAQKLSPKSSEMPFRSAAGFGSKEPTSERDCQKVSASPQGKDDASTSDLPSKIIPTQIYSPQSPPEETLAAFISHVGRDGFFYVQLAKDLPMLDSISEQLLALPDNIKHPNLSQGASCAAVFSEDSAWYRAEIIGKNGDSLSVCFVDYGNEDSVSASSVKPLSHELLACLPLAYKSQFSALGALSTDAQSKLAELTEHQMTVTFSGHSPPFSVCIKTEEGEDLQDVICPLENYRPPVAPKEVTPVGVTHIEDDGRFFVQLYQNYTAVKELQNVLKTVGETESAHIESAEVDMACCLKVEAGCWQRGKVIEVAGQSVHVFLVDSGKTVITDVGSLRSLPVQFLKTAPYALECRLKGVGEWAGGLLEKFSGMTQDKILNATFHSQTFPLRVSLARSIELDLLGLSAPPPDSPEKSPVKKASPAVVARQPAAPEVGTEGKPAYISHVDTHGGFYVQIVDREEDLNDLADNLETVLSDSDLLNEVAAGDVVCAQFTEDDAWYRARIESCTDDGQFLIRFIDYGNSDVVGADRLKALPAELDISTLPPFAVKCRFSGVAKDLTPQQADKLREMVAEQTVTAVFRSLEDDVQEVDVSLGGLHVAQSLGLETPDFKKSPDVEDDENEFFEAVEDLEKCEDVPVEDLEKCEDVPVEDLEKCEDVPVEDLEKCEDVPVEDLEKCEEVPIEDLEKCKDVPVEDLEKCEDVPVEDLEKCEDMPVVKKAVMETTDASKCPGLSSMGATVDVVDSASGASQLASSGASTESAKQELESPSSGACAKDGEPPNTASELSVISDGVPVSGAASAAGVARVSVSADDRMEVTVSHVDSPHKFYMQLDSNKPGLDDMMDALFEHLSSQSEACGPVEAAAVGDVCAALFDESWYRVRVESVTGDGTCEIFYVDYGHTETVDVSSLQHLPDRFKSMLPWALRATLGGVDPKDGCWTQEAVQEMKRLVEDRHLLADILQVSDDGVECTVHLLYLGIPVHEELVKKGHAVAVSGGPVSKNPQHFYSDGDSYGAGTRTDESGGILESTRVEGDSSTAEDQMASYRVQSRQTLGSVAGSLQELAELSVCVSHSVSISSCHFWCQLTSSSDTLSEITSALARMYGSSSEENTLTEAPRVGDVVVVSVFGDEGVFYRARVLSVIGSDEVDMAKKVRVRFVDYGHESAVPLSNVFKFHEQLYTWPAQAFCCCLDKVQPVGGTWSPEVLQAFSQTVTRQQLLLTLVGREQDGVILVDAVLQETGQSLGSLMVEAGLAKAAVAETHLAAYSKSFETSKAGDISELESLEMSQPILESTTMVMCSTRDRAPTVSFEEADDEHFRSVKLSLHTEYDVVVSNDELPSCFHVQLLELRDQYLSLVTEIADHVASNLPGDSAIFIPEPGDPCLVQHCGTWYRGLVSTKESDSWLVKSIDCGWVVKVPCDQLMALPTHLREPPAQSVPCYLAGIVSVELEWATDGIAFFIDSVQAAKLCMYVLECADDGKYGVYLSDLDNTGSQSVNRALVDLGYAEVVPGSNIEVQIEMERTLDTDMMQGLEESFNEVSQLKCNADCEWDGEAVSSIAFDSENPLKETYEDSDVFRTAKLEMDKTLYHLVQIPKSMMTSSESRPYSEDKNCLSSKDGNLPSSTDHHALQHEGVGSQKVRFDCASAVERIDKLGCVDNYPDEGLFAEYESLEDAVVREDRHVSRDSPDDIHHSRPDATAQGTGADDQAEDFCKSENVAGTSVQNCAEVQTSCAVTCEAATTTADSFEHDSPETSPHKEDTAPCGQPMAASSDAGDEPRAVDGRTHREGASDRPREECRVERTREDSEGAGDMSDLLTETIEMMIELSASSEESQSSVLLDVSTELCERDSWQEADHREGNTSRHIHVSLAGQQRTGSTSDVSGIDLCGLSGCVGLDSRDEASLQLDQGEVVPESGLALKHGCGTRDTRFVLAEVADHGEVVPESGLASKHGCGTRDARFVLAEVADHGEVVPESGLASKHGCGTRDTRFVLAEVADHGEVVPESGLASKHGCGTGDARFVLAEDAAVGLGETGFRSPTPSVESTSDEYESCHEEVLSQSLEDESNKSCFIDSSFESPARPEEHNSSYDTSILLCSNSYLDSSMDVSSLYEISSTEGSIIDSDSMFSDSTSDSTQDSSASTRTDSSFSSASTVVTTSGSSSDGASWIHEISSSSSGSSVQTLTDLSAFESEYSPSETASGLPPGSGPVGEQQQAVASLALPGTEAPGKLHLEKAYKGIPTTVLDISGNVHDIPETVLDISGNVHDISGNVQDMPETVLDIPGNVQDVPTVLDISGNVHDIPTTVLDISGNVHDIPETVLDISGNVHDIPETVLDIPGNVQDIPTTVLDISGNVQDMPATVLDIPGNVQDVSTVLDISGNVHDITETVVDIPGNVQDIPTTVLDISGNVQDMPATVLDIPGNVQDIPGNVQDIPGNVHDIPGNVQDISGNVHDILATVLDISGNVQDISGNVQDIAGNVQDMRATVLDISGNVQDVSTAVLGISGNVQDIQENVQDIPTTVLDIPGDVQDIPTTVLDISGNVKDIQGNVHDIQGNVQDIPGNVLDNPGNILDIPGNVQYVPTTVLDISGNVHDIPGTVLDIPGNVQDVPTTVLDISGNVHDIPGTVLNIPGNVQDVPTTVLDISGNVHDIPETVLDIPGNVQDVPTTVLDISGNVHDIPETVLDIPGNVQDIPTTVLDISGNVQDVPTVVDIPGNVQGILITVPDTPETAVGIAVATPETAVGIAVATPETAVGIAVATPETAVGIAVATPETAVGIAVATPETAVGIAVAMPETVVGIAVATPETAVGIAVATPETAVGIAVATTETAVGIAVATPEPAVGIAKIVCGRSMGKHSCAVVVLTEAGMQDSIVSSTGSAYSSASTVGTTESAYSSASTVGTTESAYSSASIVGTTESAYSSASTVGISLGSVRGDAVWRHDFSSSNSTSFIQTATDLSALESESEHSPAETATSETAGGLLPGSGFVCEQAVRSLVPSVPVDLTDRTQAPGEVHSGVAGLPDSFQGTQAGYVVLCEEDTPKTVPNTSETVHVAGVDSPDLPDLDVTQEDTPKTGPNTSETVHVAGVDSPDLPDPDVTQEDTPKTGPNTSETVHVAGVDSPDLPDPDVTQATGDREADMSDIPRRAHTTDTVSTDVCESVSETIHRTNIDQPDLSAKAVTETSVGISAISTSLSRTVVDIPTIVHVEETDKNSCVDDMPAEGNNYVTSTTCDMNGNNQTHATSVDGGATTVLSSADHHLDCGRSRDHWQKAQQHKTPKDDMSTGSLLAVDPSCRFPAVMVATDSTVVDNVCDRIWNKSDDQGKAVSLNEWSIKGDQKLESFSDWVVTGVKSGSCGEVKSSADTKINEGDVAPDAAVCGPQLIEDEDCSNCPDVRVDEGDVACRDVALDAAGCGPQLIEDEDCSNCPDAKVNEGDVALDAAVCAPQLLEDEDCSNCPDAKVSEGDVALDAAVCVPQLLEDCSNCPDAKVSEGDVALDAAVCVPQLLEDEDCSNCPDAKVNEEDVACSDVALDAAVCGAQLETDVCVGECSDVRVNEGDVALDAVVCEPQLETDVCVGECPDAVKPQEDVDNSVKGCLPEGLPLCGAEREHKLLPSHDDMNSVHPIQDVKDEELPVDAAGDAGPCETAGASQETMEAPEA